jgi:molecular chaperone GrpE
VPDANLESDNFSIKRTVENFEIKTDDVSAEPTTVPETATPAELDQLRIERDGLRVERDELRETLLRRQAEFDNFRKRTERERLDQSQYASMEVVGDLVPILDDFERALAAESGSPEYAKGIQMIYQRMAESLKKTGLEPIEAVGKPFDPHQHQAIERVETNDSPENTVIGEFQRGYNFKGKLLRPSMVRVAVAAPARNDSRILKI